MVCRYRDTKKFYITIDELKRRLLLIDPKTGKDKYPKFGLFRANVLDVAQKELQEKADISFTYEPKKTGKKYTHLSIKIISYEAPVEVLETKQVEVQEPSTNDAEALNRVCKKLTDRYKLTPWQAKKIIQRVPLKLINETLYNIQLEISAKKVHNVGGYTYKIFERKYDQVFK